MTHSKIFMEHEDEFYDLMHAFSECREPNKEYAEGEYDKELNSFFKKHGSKEFLREWNAIHRMKVPAGVHI